MGTSAAGSEPSSAGNNYNLARSVSKKQQKAQKTSMFYRELTDALHSKVADFMVGVEDLDDSEDVKTEISKLIDELSHRMQEETHDRKATQDRLEARCEKLEQYVTDMFGKIDTMENARGAAEENARVRLIAHRDDVEQQMNQAMQEHHARMLREMGRQIELAGRRFEEMAASLQQNVEKVMSSPKIDKMQEQLEACEQHCSTLDGHCIDSLQRCQQLQDRLDNVDSRFNEEVGGLINEHGGVRHELRKLGDMNNAIERHRDGVQECLDNMDHKHERLCTAVKELAKNAANELQSTRDELDQVWSVMWNVKKAWGDRDRLRNMRSPRRSARGHGEEPTSPGGSANAGASIIPVGFGSPRQPFLAGA